MIPRPFLLLGDPVSHSWSPLMHAAALRAGGHPGVYGAVRCLAAEVAPLMRSLARTGGGGNVTVPHKLAAAGQLDHASAAVTRTGACNTFWGAGGRLHGDNTDVAAVRAEFEALLGGEPPARALLLGAGGAARAAAVALEDAGCRELYVWSRGGDAVRRLRGTFGGLPPKELAAPGEAPGEFDVVVNATPLGLASTDALPLDPRHLRVRAVLDLAYASGGTEWVRRCRAQGIAAADGRGVLVAQAEAAFACWWGEAPPAGVMAAALPAGG
jgi:shikimate dehydrogenase